MGNVSREMAILRKNQKEMLEMKNAVRGMKNAFGGLISKKRTVKKESLS